MRKTLFALIRSEEAERQKKLKMELESAKDRLRKAEAALA